jgi:hypothetical protein
MDGTRSGLCQTTGFGASGVNPSGSVTKELVGCDISSFGESMECYIPTQNFRVTQLF